MTSTIGIPIKLLNEAEVRLPTLPQETLQKPPADTPRQGHIVTLEITSGTTYRGKLLEGKPSTPHTWLSPLHRASPY